MRRNIRRIRIESGQTLVWVAVGMVVLIGMLGLAIDGGSLYGERRHMQNAADAAALEAARARCFDNLSAAAAAQKGQTFAAANYVRPRATAQGFTVVPRATNDYEFDSTAWEDVPLYFARIFGFAPVRVEARAAAACGPSERACGFFPLAFDENLWNTIDEQCGQQIYVWDGEAPNSNYVPNCTTLCDCTKVYDNQRKLIPGAIAVANVGRAWLDFTSAASPLNPIDCGGNNGCGTQELRCWILNDSQVLILDDVCVSGTDGVKLGVHQDIDARKGDYVTVPLFNGRCPASGSGVCDPLGFNITSFGCVQVGGLSPQPVYIDWKATPTPDPAKPNLNWPQYCVSDKLLYVNIGCDKCATECGATSGGGNPGSGVKAISLIR